MAQAKKKSKSIDPAKLVGLDHPMTASDSFHFAAAKLLLERKLLTLVGLSSALRKRATHGSDLAHILVADGQVRRVDYYKAVADIHKLPFVDLRTDPADVELADLADRAAYTALNFIPWRNVNGRTLIATTEITPEHVHWADLKYGIGNYSFVITSPYDILWQCQSTFRESDGLFAREALHAWKPDHSAKITFTRTQRLGLLWLLLLFSVAVVMAPYETMVVLMTGATAIYTMTFAFKFMLTWVGASRRADMQISAEQLTAVDDYSLPIYTVLVPMYREAKVLPLLVNALKKIDYPSSKLEIKLVLEEDDVETIEAAKAMKLPGSFEIVRVPPSYPKTKPKACNYALQYCRGEFVTVYDAEDQPEPDQLKKAVVAFRSAPQRLACVQGRLNYFNRSENWLTRMFTLEYSQWFDFLLPGLDWLKVPIPLGGTSNHFKLAVLREVGAWDPYNVTEDADLGIRLAQEGYAVGVINSTTYEEANTLPSSWVKQRSRWIKGYMQTWLVHMRHPIRLWRSIGAKGFLAFQFFIGAPPFTMLLNPILWAVTAVVLLTNTYDFGWLFPEPFGTLALFNLLVGNLFLIYFGVVAAMKRRYYDLVIVGIMQPFYWVLHSIAAYKALWQLIRNPHHWEKTEHGTSTVTQQTLQDMTRTAA